MAIPEAQLETWSHQGPTTQFTATNATLKSVLHDSSAPYANRQFSTLLQGSYFNDTNIYADSDVDIVIRLDSVYFSDVEGLSEEDRTRYDESWSPADYKLSDFKNDVTGWLKTK